MPRSLSPLPATCGRALVWLLVLALAVYGHRATLVQLLGPEHRHTLSRPAEALRLPTAVLEVFQDIRDWRDGLRARWLGTAAVHRHGDGEPHRHPAADMPPHEHAALHRHGGFARHHHASGDASLVALDGVAADAAAQAGAGSATLPLAVVTGWTLPRPAWRALRWPSSPPEAWTDALRRLPERPPRA
jgi:hypothetical protein